MPIILRIFNISRDFSSPFIFHGLLNIVSFRYCFTHVTSFVLRHASSSVLTHRVYCIAFVVITALSFIHTAATLL